MSIRNKLHIMIVDDMSTSRGIITQELDTLGVTNYTYEKSGIEALNRLAARPVHLVMSDYNMPGMNGLELLAELRKVPKLQNIAFILVTGSPTNDMIERGKSLRLNSILKKPFTTMQIKTCIESVVGKL
tara:strand:- start:2869 stop:3255 length:387 start_codon:yes stop_codon:yes gene_type:complete